MSLEKMIKDSLDYLPTLKKLRIELTSGLKKIEAEGSRESDRIQRENEDLCSQTLKALVESFWEKIVNFEATPVSLSDLPQEFKEDIVQRGLELGVVARIPKKFEECKKGIEFFLEGKSTEIAAIFNQMILYAATREKKSDFRVYEQIVRAGICEDFDSFNSIDQDRLKHRFESIKENLFSRNLPVKFSEERELELLSQWIVNEIIGEESSGVTAANIPEAKYLLDFLGAKEGRDVESLLVKLNDCVVEPADEVTKALHLVMKIVLNLKKALSEDLTYEQLVIQYDGVKKSFDEIGLSVKQVDDLLSRIYTLGVCEMNPLFYTCRGKSLEKLSDQRKIGIIQDLVSRETGRSQDDSPFLMDEDIDPYLKLDSRDLVPSPFIAISESGERYSPYSGNVSVRSSPVNYTMNFKKQVALAALQESKTLEAVATEYRVSLDQVVAWKRQALIALDGAF